MKVILSSILLVFSSAVALAAEVKIDVFPPTAYDQATAYLNLGFFWAGIIGLVILLKLKLRELERTQKMDREEAQESAPLLE